MYVLSLPFSNLIVGVKWMEEPSRTTEDSVVHTHTHSRVNKGKITYTFITYDNSNVTYSYFYDVQTQSVLIYYMKYIVLVLFGV